MHIYLPCWICQTCTPMCGIWLNDVRDFPAPFFANAGEAKNGFIVASDVLPVVAEGAEQVPNYEINENGSIPTIARSPCPTWENRIRRMYAKGYRYIYFSPTQPEGEQFEERMFDSSIPGTFPPLDISA